MRPRTGGIVFDKDGTLYDFNATWGAWAHDLLQDEAGGDPELMARLAAVLDYDMTARRFGPGSVVIAHTTEEVADVVLPLLPGRSKAALMAELDAKAARAPQVEAADLRHLLGDLRARGLRLGVVTNDSEAPARAHLRRSGIEGLLDFVAGADSGHGAKPEPGQLAAFCAATGVAAETCVMVGDSLHDLKAGRAAGMTVLAVLTGPAPRDALEAQCDAVLDSVADLPGWLDRR